jgi:site-specific recombinase XerD
MSEVKELIDKFLNQLQESSSINTLKAYKSDLHYLEDKFHDLNKLHENNLREMRLHLIEQYAPKTAARRWSAWREFFRFCQLAGYLKENPIANLDIEAPNKVREIRTQIKQELLTTICDYPTERRNRALLWFIFSTGVRPSELVKFGIFKNLNLAAKEFYIEGRTTFLCDKAYDELTMYLDERNQNSQQQAPGLFEAIFTNELGKPIHEMYPYTLFSQIAQKLGIKASLSDLRDCLLTKLSEAGAKPEELKYYLGFKSIKSIEPILQLISKSG